MQQRLYDVGDKDNKLLAWLDRSDQERSWVLEIEDEGGRFQRDGPTIANAFADSDGDLYPMGDADCMDLLRDIHLSELEEESRVPLEEDLTVEEITQAMRGLQSGKAMGPNGLPIEMCKVMANKVATHLLAMLQTALQDGILLDDQRMATIIVIHKALWITLYDK
ncbi:hypothetical protein NDU88_006873 [Pleurodeles waltl]|uniref:Uncharacterized protein n=1 Tax=Pleurodeles waltl TaxID=8319 RepID=A0AAV7LQD7_PLEWA|nr:hypothetical protein NDU88_006873 [Pleurodeles waltl]